MVDILDDFHGCPVFTRDTGQIVAGLHLIDNRMFGPFRRKDLPELIKFAHKKGIETSITTNATLIDKAKAKELIKAGISQINISIDSYMREVHNALVGVEDAWERSSAAFKHLRRIRGMKNKTTRLVMQTVICKENIHDIQKIAAFARQVGADSLSRRDGGKSGHRSQGVGSCL